jgi:hypothetical protein
MDRSLKEWSGRWDSNPRLDLGKVPYYPYTTTALKQEKLYHVIRAAARSYRAPKITNTRMRQ